MNTLQDIKQQFAAEEARIMGECFNLSADAQQVDISMTAGVRERLGEGHYNAVRAAEAEERAVQKRIQLKAEYLAAFEAYVEARDKRVAEIEEAFSPKGVDAALLLEAAKATSEQLISLMDLALQSGNEPAALLAFKAGRERDLEDVVAHALTLREDWSDLYGELVLVQADPELSAGERFEMFAAPAPTKETLL